MVIVDKVLDNNMLVNDLSVFLCVSVFIIWCHFFSSFLMLSFGLGTAVQQAGDAGVKSPTFHSLSSVNSKACWDMGSQTNKSLFFVTWWVGLCSKTKYKLAASVWAAKMTVIKMFQIFMRSSYIQTLKIQTGAYFYLLQKYTSK